MSKLVLKKPEQYCSYSFLYIIVFHKSFDAKNSSLYPQKVNV